MDKVAKLSLQDRNELFAAAATKKGTTTDLIEKDFWVCWLLKKLFALEDLSTTLIFKGGTSLSKVYHLIERFSEDVDLSFDRTLWGFPDSAQLLQMGSKERRRKLDELKQRSETFIREDLLPRLQNVIRGDLGTEQTAGWRLDITPEDSQNMKFVYPFAGSSNDEGYLRPFVLLEFGGRSDHWPKEEGKVTPYAAEVLPREFDSATCKVHVFSAQRTFWEKATLLHRWYHRADKSMALRQSRHYYDLCRIYDNPLGKIAIADVNLLAEVVRHKRAFYEEPAARYDLASPETLHLRPHANHLAILRQDYDDMSQMFFVTPPAFDDLLKQLGEMEKEINEHKPLPPSSA